MHSRFQMQHWHDADAHQQNSLTRYKNVTRTKILAWTAKAKHT